MQRYEEKSGNSEKIGEKSEKFIENQRNSEKIQRKIGEKRRNSEKYRRKSEKIG